MSAAIRTQTTRVIVGKRSNIRCAKTDPISVAVAPLPPWHAPAQHGGPSDLADAPRQDGIREQADAERREDERGTSGCGGSIDCSMHVSHEIERATTERRLRPIADRDPGPRHRGERVVYRGASRGRARRPARPRPRATQDKPTTTSHVLLTPRPRGRPLRAAARCRPRRSWRAHARAPRVPSRRGAPRRRARR